jgi:hypothetical protein
MVRCQTSGLKLRHCRRCCSARHPARHSPGLLRKKQLRRGGRGRGFPVFALLELHFPLQLLVVNPLRSGEGTRTHLGNLVRVYSQFEAALYCGAARRTAPHSAARDAWRTFVSTASPRAYLADSCFGRTPISASSSFRAFPRSPALCMRRRTAPSSSLLRDRARSSGRGRLRPVTLVSPSARAAGSSASMWPSSIATGDLLCEKCALSCNQHVRWQRPERVLQEGRSHAHAATLLRRDRTWRTNRLSGILATLTTAATTLVECTVAWFIRDACPTVRLDGLWARCRSPLC